MKDKKVIKKLKVKDQNSKKVKISILIIIFIFSFVLRLWNLNAVGRAPDEPAQAMDGYNFIELLRKGDFSNAYFYDHSYHPPLSKYIYGLALYNDIASNKISTKPSFLKGEPTFKYDLTTARLVSVLFSSLTVVLVCLIGFEFISILTGVFAGIIFSMMPFYIGLSQLVTIESILIFFFTASIYAFIKYLKNNSIKNMVITAILTGLAFESKFTNLLLIPIFIWIYLLWYFYEGIKLHKSIINKKIILILPLAFFVFALLWPMPFFHLKEVIDMNYQLRIHDTGLSIPEVFFGKLILVPKIYYIVHFIITTPLLVLLLFLYGLKKISDYAKDKKKSVNTKWILYSFIVWFLVPFILSFYNFRQHGVRYIIEIYVPLALIAAYGFEQITNKISNKYIWKIAMFIPIIVYMFIIIIRITPYYLDYFNILVGGAKNVYEKRMFQLGWWAGGEKQAIEYLDSIASHGSKVGLALEPRVELPSTKNLKVYQYKRSEKYDYVIVNYFNVTRIEFKDDEVIKHYNPIYNVKADGANLVTIYKRK